MFYMISIDFLQGKMKIVFVSSTVKVVKLGTYHVTTYSVIQNLGNLDFLSTTIVLWLFSRKTSVVHIFNPTLQGYSCTLQELMSSDIHSFSYSYHQKVVIGRFVNL